jgi:hypothetical protein
VARQEVEQAEFLGTQMQRPAVPMQFARVETELDAIDDAQPMAVARLARLLCQKRQATAQLFGIDIDGKCRIEPAPRAASRWVTPS